jgi:hypothetical protein
MIRLACPRAVDAGFSCFFSELLLDSSLPVWEHAKSRQNGTGQERMPKSLLLPAAAYLRQRSKETQVKELFQASSRFMPCMCWLRRCS